MSTQSRRQIIRFALGLLTGIGFFGMLALLAFKAIPEANKDVFIGFSGFLGGAFSTIIGFYFTDTEARTHDDNQ